MAFFVIRDASGSGKGVAVVEQYGGLFVSSVGFWDMIVSLGGGTCMLVSTLRAGTIPVVSSTLGVGTDTIVVLSTLGVGTGTILCSTLGFGLSTLGVGTVTGLGTLVVYGAF
jgi:hypothetical protein